MTRKFTRKQLDAIFAKRRSDRLSGDPPAIVTKGDPPPDDRFELARKGKGISTTDILDKELRKHPSPIDPKFPEILYSNIIFLVKVD